MDLPEPRRYRISGYTKTPHEYVTETVDAVEWNRFRAGEGKNPLKRVTDWVLVEDA